MSMAQAARPQLSGAKRELYMANSTVINFYRRNPVIACEQLLGIKLLDFQRYLLNGMWRARRSVMLASRNAGKSMIGAVYIILTALLFPNSSIYIVAPTGSQSKELFEKIEEIVLRVGKTANSIKSLRDIVMYETETNGSCPTGFKHDAGGYTFTFHNGSKVTTLNGNPTNVRSRRATLVFYDEFSWVPPELAVATAAFATQDTEFATSTEENFDIRGENSKRPAQLIYASSAGDLDSGLYRMLKEYTRNMLMGDTEYFATSIDCTVPISPTMNGKPYKSLLSEQHVKDEMKKNRFKALREYYNIFDVDGGNSQLIKRAMVKRNSTFKMPMLKSDGKSKFALAFDPARTADNSCITVMKISKDPVVGYYGEIVNSINMIDYSSKKGLKLNSTLQLQILKDMILAYNGKMAADYENISKLLIDAGAGGAGMTSYADPLLYEWDDEDGNTHKGMIDLESKVYKELEGEFPNALTDVISLVSPTKEKENMCEELKDLMTHDLIKFPMEYDGSGQIVEYKPHPTKRDEEISIVKSLDQEEIEALDNIDILKQETCHIHGYPKAGSGTRYDLPPDKKGLIGDDRFYTLILLAHHLAELRRNDMREANRPDIDYSKYFRSSGNILG